MYDDSTFHARVVDAAHQCADLLIDRKLVKRPKLFKRMLEVKTKAVRGCWGGLTPQRRNKPARPTITIAKRYATATGDFWEYPRHREDPEIGAFNSDNTDHHILAVVAHEIAHAADHWSGDYSSHGSEWRHRYRTLRRELGLIF